jgi:hypothetical protein
MLETSGLLHCTHLSILLYGPTLFLYAFISLAIYKDELPQVPRGDFLAVCGVGTFCSFQALQYGLFEVCSLLLQSNDY